MSAVVTRMQDLAYEFSKDFRGDTPGPPHAPASTPSTACGRPRVASAPMLGSKPRSLSTCQPWLRPPEHVLNITYNLSYRMNLRPTWRHFGVPDGVEGFHQRVVVGGLSVDELTQRVDGLADGRDDDLHPVDLASKEGVHRLKGAHPLQPCAYVCRDVVIRENRHDVVTRLTDPGQVPLIPGCRRRCRIVSTVRGQHGPHHDETASRRLFKVAVGSQQTNQLKKYSPSNSFRYFTPIG